ncbi:hypothetical protein SEA_LONELYBOI_74 [Gordonia phage LonelyBoi]|nr:hypothetical protein SEA_LONELYBOI_74 [Gordonia phage LonelyBoi]
MTENRSWRGLIKLADGHILQGRIANAIKSQDADTETLEFDFAPDWEGGPVTARMVNRVPTLDRPPHPDAPYPEVVAYFQGWQKRHPDVDLQAVLDAAVAHVCGLLNEIPGVQIDPSAIDTRLDRLPTEEPSQ